MANVVQYSQPAVQSQVGDPINQLPVDHTPPTNNEIQIIDTLFRKHRGAMDVVFEEAKDALLVGVLLIAFSLPQIDELLTKFLPVTERSPYIKLLLKGLLAAALFWLVKHFYLSRKNSG